MTCMKQTRIYTLGTEIVMIVSLHIIVMEKLDTNVQICCKFYKITHLSKQGQEHIAYSHIPMNELAHQIMIIHHVSVLKSGLKNDLITQT